MSPRCSGIHRRSTRPSVSWPISRSLRLARSPPDFLTDGVDLFVRKFGTLIDLNRPEQILIEELLESHLRRIDRDATGPVRFFPVVISDAERPIAVDPRVAFGHPVVAGTRVRMEIISGRVAAGDSVEAVSEDLGLTKQQVEQAVAFEQRAKRQAA